MPGRYRRRNRPSHAGFAAASHRAKPPRPRDGVGRCRRRWGLPRAAANSGRDACRRDRGRRSGTLDSDCRVRSNFHGSIGSLAAGRCRAGPGPTRASKARPRGSQRARAAPPAGDRPEQRDLGPSSKPRLRDPPPSVEKMEPCPAVTSDRGVSRWKPPPTDPKRRLWDSARTTCSLISAECAGRSQTANRNREPLGCRSREPLPPSSTPLTFS